TMSRPLGAGLRRRGAHHGAHGSRARRWAIVAELLAQDLLIELADAGPGQRRHEHDLIRNGVARYNPLARVFLQSRLDLAVADRTALLEHHDGKGAFGPLRIRNADDRSFAHAGVLENEILDIERGDPFAAGLDNVFEPIGDFQIAIGADDADVT